MMKISPQFNKYINAFIKEFNQSDMEMLINVEGKLLRFIPKQYDFKTIREIFKEISLFPMEDGKRISFSKIDGKELLDCIYRFKEWANLNGFEWNQDQEELQRLIQMYERG